MVDERHLPDDLPGSELVDLLAADVDPGRAVEDDERLLPGATLADQLAAGLGLALLGQLGDAAQLVGAEALEEGDVGELGGDSVASGVFFRAIAGQCRAAVDGGAR